MKPNVVNAPVMVGDIRQIGGEKIQRDASRATDLTAEFETLDTSTWQAEEQSNRHANALDHRLTAATLMGERDAMFTELKLGSYVLFPILFYHDKDWLSISGFTEAKLQKDPERIYNLNPVVARPSTKAEREKEKKEKKKKEKKEKKDSKKKRRR